MQYDVKSYLKKKKKDLKIHILLSISELFTHIYIFTL